MIMLQISSGYHGNVNQFGFVAYLSQKYLTLLLVAFSPSGNGRMKKRSPSADVRIIPLRKYNQSTNDIKKLISQIFFTKNLR